MSANLQLNNGEGRGTHLEDIQYFIRQNKNLQNERGILTMTEKLENTNVEAVTTDLSRPTIGQQILVASFDEKTPEGFLQFLNATTATSGTYKEVEGKELVLQDVLVYADTKLTDDGEIKTEEVGVIFTNKGTFGGVAANINTTLKALAASLNTTLKGKEVKVKVVGKKSKSDRTFYTLEMSM